MEKYDWIALKQDFLLGEYKSVSDFFKQKGIKDNSRNRTYTKDWKNEKWKNSGKIVEKTVEKVIEEISTEQAKTIVKIDDAANDLVVKIMEATGQLNIYVDMFGNQHTSIVDRSDIKKLTSALKDLKDILSDDGGNNIPQKRVQIVNDLPGCDENDN